MKKFREIHWSGQKWYTQISFLPARMSFSGQKWILGVSFMPAPIDLTKKLEKLKRNTNFTPSFHIVHQLGIFLGER